MICEHSAEVFLSVICFYIVIYNLCAYDSGKGVVVD